MAKISRIWLKMAKNGIKNRKSRFFILDRFGTFGTVSISKTDRFSVYRSISSVHPTLWTECLYQLGVRFSAPLTQTFHLCCRSCNIGNFYLSSKRCRKTHFCEVLFQSTDEKSIISSLSSVQVHCISIFYQ